MGRPPEMSHVSAIHPIIVLVLLAKNQIEVAGHRPGTGAVFSDCLELLKEDGLVPVLTWSVDRGEPPFGVVVGRG